MRWQGGRPPASMRIVKRVIGSLGMVAGQCSYARICAGAATIGYPMRDAMGRVFVHLFPGNRVNGNATSTPANHSHPRCSVPSSFVP